MNKSGQPAVFGSALARGSGARMSVLAAMRLSAEERKHGEHTTVLAG